MPLPGLPEDFNRPAGRSVGYYPLVGLLLGGGLAGLDWALSMVTPMGLRSALVLTLWVALTGLLHLDGLMDVCDGLLPPRDRARRLEIMKDSRVGAFAVVGAVLLLLVKFNALLALSDPARWRSLLVVPVLARWAMSWSMYHYPPASQQGLGVFFKTGLGWPQLSFASIVAFGVALGLWGWSGLALLALTWLLVTLVARFALARIGGLTGDVYGATCELVEAGLLVQVVLINYQ